jgi:hypothetical protein
VVENIIPYITPGEYDIFSHDRECQTLQKECRRRTSHRSGVKSCSTTHDIAELQVVYSRGWVLMIPSTYLRAQRKALQIN